MFCQQKIATGAVVVFLSFHLCLKAQTGVALKEKDVLAPSNKESLSGYLNERLDAAYNNRILAQDEPKLIEPFKNRTEARCWQSEFWGKWFTSAVLAYRYRPEQSLKVLLDKAVEDLVATQTQDGYIGNYAPDKHLQQWDIWGRKYCLLGLLAYYDVTRDKKTLLAAQKLTDHLMQELHDAKLMISKQGNHRGMAATSVLEPVCLLYTRTGNKKYLAFAEEIVRQWETPDGPQLISKAGVNVAERFPKPKNWWGWEQGQKAYEMMSCYEGLLELYRITGNPSYKEAVERTWNNIQNTEINLAGSGSAMECWFGGQALQTLPVKRYQETCVTATWIKLSQQLLRLTGDAKYADAIELSYYNALLCAMSTDGSDWAKYSPLQGQREKGEEQCGMGINCCVASGPRGLFTLPSTMVMQTSQGVSINFFAAGSFQLKTPAGQNITIEQETQYPANGKIVVRLKLSRPESFTLRIRIPAWSKQTSLYVNKEVNNEWTAGSFAAINRVWKDGDRLELNLDMRGRVVTMGEPQKSMALYRGPILLSRDVRLTSLEEDLAMTPVLNKDGFCELEPVAVSKDNIWLQYKAKFIAESPSDEQAKTVDLLLCDYSSAGNTIDKHSAFNVWFPQLIDPSKR